ncbi:alkaline phosphatase D family protein [Kordiimonas sp. SCSIO 12603]|uniref:alkaline phosphatase D family protein n=1 Tax=Kordiimonas sp. SCSIO 12603 TaxID=2829596 RepID=UPI002103D505|nr:alkaline phosphatase D family protein [Kordiimonas sp. SCSIO 12603]UTW58264.1 alkaline phosphatase D family protein [Kordiimonas sp. SCSIO 12603]
MFKKPVSGPNRRHILTGIGATTALLATAGTTARAATKAGFHHGVASGDPLQDAVIIWTRYYGEDIANKNISGAWQISETPSFENVIKEGSFKTGPSRDFTVKVDVQGLKSGTQYYYRFSVGNTVSPTGSTKTLPADAKEAKLAVVSCSNYPQGYFNVYRKVAARPFDAVLHLGDYIYEYGDGTYDNPEAKEKGRTVKPKTEIISLDDYRTRYALYRSDDDLQAVHAAHPFICVWDDHEVANDTWKDGAQNHNEGEGPFAARRKAAMKAYYEWMPIRETAAVNGDAIYRTFEFGDLASLIMLDTRNIGRDRGYDYQKDLPYRSIPFNFSDQANPVAVLDPAALKNIPTAAIKFIPVPFDLRGKRPVPMTNLAEIQKLDPKKLPKGFSYLPDVEKFNKEMLHHEERTLLGSTQENWLSEELQKSKAAGKPWQILGQQVLAGKLGMPSIADEHIDIGKSKYVSKEIIAFMRMLGQMGMPLNLDAWDGYPAARERAFKAIKEHANNAVFLAGDTHNAWAFNLTDQAGDNVAVELGTPSVSSPGLESYLPAPTNIVEKALMDASPELVHINGKDRGWLELTIRPEEISAEWFYVSSVLEKECSVESGKKLVSKAGKHTLT